MTADGLICGLSRANTVAPKLIIFMFEIAVNAISGVVSGHHTWAYKPLRLSWAAPLFHPARWPLPSLLIH